MLQIRLAKIGRSNRPSFRVVVAEKRTNRNGRILEFLGFFDPRSPQKSSLKKEKIAYWQSQGAQVTESVQALISGNYQFKEYRPARGVTKQ